MSGEYMFKDEKPQDGIIYTTPEKFREYVFNPTKEELQLKSGMTQEQIDAERTEMMRGRKDVTWRNFLVRVGETA